MSESQAQVKSSRAHLRLLLETLASIQAFFLAMAQFPEAQKKAQAELDAVVGSHRLPDFSDESALPYVCALVKECLRWHAVLPLAVPHRLIEDDIYRGYHIPKGTVVIPNIWWVLCVSHSSAFDYDIPGRSLVTKPDM